MLLFVYTSTRKRFVIFTCRYFKLSWNTTALSQSNYRNSSSSSINSEISFWFRSLNDAYRKYTGNYISWCLERFLLRSVCMPAFKVAKVAGPGNHWPDQAPSWTERSFSMMEDFRQSSEAVGLSQVSNILWELTGQISAHYSSFEIKILIYLFFVRTKDHIPYCLPQIWCIKSTNGWFTRHQICCQDFVMKANLLNTKHHFSILASLLERRIEPIDCKV